MPLLKHLFSVEGKIALVTGGVSGIGRMIAGALAGAGAYVYVTSRSDDTAVRMACDIAEAHGGNVSGIPATLDTEEGIAALVETLSHRTTSLDILVNNAGRTYAAPLEDFPYKAWERVMSINVAAAFGLTQRLLPMLTAHAGADDPSRVVNLGSILGTRFFGTRAYSYAASKAALHHLTRMLAGELASRHITVNAISPGPFESRMMRAVANDADRRREMQASVPLARWGRAEDVAAATLFLCGRGGTYVTGAVLPLDGGKHISDPPPSRYSGNE